MKNLILIALFLFCSVAHSQNILTTEKCKSSTNQRVRKNCINKELNAYANTNFDVNRIATYAQLGENRVYTRVSIDHLGRITNIQVKGTAPELEQEAIRVLEQYDGFVLLPEQKSTASDENTNDFTVLISFMVDATEYDHTATANF
ncbi:energy transducer TonB [Aquimarina brevivitae]|uniref:TonB-like protein n=1 Tax=Aquimarina brevivitae TaxID=323412 RepID=A0A4Q7PID2_9FLAO|nr:hypothetical protein [Aquimarina brevivitae]RZS99738.1 hypothetical protein EV197_0963 [Aquimarina brevivitae]